ncbi:MAG: VWA domain-containing protein [Candidatus Njordarchaeia archaeon]
MRFCSKAWRRLQSFFVDKFDVDKSEVREKTDKHVKDASRRIREEGVGEEDEVEKKRKMKKKKLKKIDFGKLPFGRKRIRKTEYEVEKAVSKKVTSVFGEHYRKRIEGDFAVTSGEKKGEKNIPISFDLSLYTSGNLRDANVEFYTSYIRKLKLKKHILKRFKESSLKSSKQGLQSINVSSGRHVGSEKYAEGKMGSVDFFGTIINLVKSRSLEKLSIPLELEKEDLMIKRRASNIPILLVTVVDTSKSMEFFSGYVLEALFQLKRYFWESRNKIAIIACRGESAKVLLQPTTNFEKLKRSFLEMKFGGITPLPEALLLAYRMVKIEKLKNRGLIPIVLVITDGLANVPLKEDISAPIRKIYGLPSYADILALGKVFKREGIPIIVLNPSHFDKWSLRLLPPPSQVLRKISETTDGKYIGLTMRDISKISSEKELLAKLVLEAIMERLSKK